MRDAGKIVIGLIIFVAVVTSPMWYHMVVGAEPAPPDLVLPAEYDKCVEATEYMRVKHMDLLNHWRDDVVRRGDRDHVAPDGTVYDKSLSRTCMNCHDDKEQFCDRCHTYAAVTPYCWSCHVDPKEVK